MFDPHFIDIPVYRLAPERYYKEMESFIHKTIYPGLSDSDEMIRQLHLKNPDREMRLRDHLRTAYGGAWNYNEIIGYIELHFLGTQIRGEYWQMKGKRIQRTRRKESEYRTWKLAPEMDIPDEASNSEIFALIRDYISDCAKELKGRHLDVSRFETIGPHVDWRALLRSN